MTPRIVEIRQEFRQHVSKKNDLLAATLRQGFLASGTLAVSLVSSPGSGKTALLERTLASAPRGRRVAALVGDPASAQDAARLRRWGAPVRQITTGTVSHLDAQSVANALDGWPPGFERLDWLFIENVGNLVCPASHDLGEQLRVVLLSVTEGEDKPLKYPAIFNSSDLVLVTKIDLADAVGFDRAALQRHLDAVRPGMPVIEVSARTGEGVDRWTALLEEQARSMRAVAAC